ncbi:MAG: hypothetical protein WC222_05280 [Parachlamydiales bacterium]
MESQSMYAGNFRLSDVNSEQQENAATVITRLPADVKRNREKAFTLNTVLWLASLAVSTYASTYFVLGGALAGGAVAIAGKLTKSPICTQIAKPFFHSVFTNKFIYVTLLTHHFVSLERMTKALDIIKLGGCATYISSACAFTAKYMPFVLGFQFGITLPQSFANDQKKSGRT